MFYSRLAILFALFCVALCDFDISKKCGNNVQCVEQEVVKAIEEFSAQKKVEILGDFAIMERTTDVIETRADADFIDKIANFFSNYKLNLKLPANERDVQKLLQEARSSKLKKIILPLLILMKLKAAIIIPAVLSGIALVAFKGLGASLIALAISGATALKSLLEGHSTSKFTYEVVPPHSHWSRSGLAGIEGYPVPGYHTIPSIY